MAVGRRGPAQIIEGKVDRFAVGEIISQLYKDQATGILLLKRGEEEKKIVFREGVIVYATSTNKEEKLGYLLVEEGRIGREELIEAAKEKKDLRGFLQEKGVLSEDDLDDAMAGLITDIVATAFDWTSGDFSFVEKEALEIPGMVDGVSMPDLFLEGVRFIQDPDRVRDLLGEEEGKVSPGADPDLLAQEIHLEPSEELVFSQIDGTRSVAAVVADSMMGPEMTRSFLTALVLSGHLEVEGRKKPSLPRPTRRSRLARKRRKGGRRGVRRSVLKKRKTSAAKPTSGSKAAAAPKPEEAEPAPEEPFEDRIRRLHAETAQQDHYEILGVDRKAEDDEIRKKYYKLAQTYHPDKLAGDTDEALRQQLEELFGRIGEAYNVLRHEESRKEYDEQLAAGEAGADKKSVDPQEVARESFEKGKKLMKADPASAARFFQHAADTAPDKGEYWYYLGMALSQQSMSRKKAEEAFLQAMKLDPANYRIYFKLGLLYKAGGLKSRAADMIRKGLNWDPENLKMQQVLAELEGDSDDKKGGLGGLFRRG